MDNPEKKIEELENRLEKAENTIQRLQQIINAQVFPNEPPDRMVTTEDRRVADELIQIFTASNENS